MVAIARVEPSPEPARPPARSPAREGTVGACMTAPARVLAPDLSLRAAATLLLDERIGGAPVVDAAGRVVGMLSRSDALRAACDGAALGAVTAGDVMMAMLISVDVDAPIERAAALMAYEGIHRLPVVDAGGALVGIVTPLDVARELARRGGYAP